jgi:heptosyltransferase-2
MRLGQDVQRLVWIQTGFLGDIVLSTAAFHWVRQTWPSVRQELVTTPLGARALLGHPDLDAVHIFDKRGQNLWSAASPLRRALRGGTQGVILQAHRSARSSLLARILGLPVVTYQETTLSLLAARRVPRIALLHETQRILLLLEALGVDRSQYVGALPFLTPLETSLGQKLRDWSRGQPLLGIAPGSVWGTKRWPQESFRALVQGLLERNQGRIVILGTQEESEAAAAVAALEPTFPGQILNLAGQSSLDDLRAVVPQLSLLVCNDSAPLHYASAFRVPSLAIFGATVPALGFGPLAPGSRVAGLQLDCRPCSDHGPQVCPLGHFRCMRELTPSFVLRQALDLLERTESHFLKAPSVLA